MVQMIPLKLNSLPILIFVGSITSLIVVFCAILLFVPSLFVFPTITDIASIATLITTILVYITIREMQKQRQAAYKPLIFLNNSKDLYYLFIFDPDENNNPIFFSLVNDNILLEDREKVDKSQFRITAYNLGVGVATNIKVQFNFDYSKFLEKIKEFTIYKNLEIICGDNEISFRGLDCCVKLYLKNKDCKLFDYLLPVNIEKNTLQIQLPEPFKYLYSALIFSQYYSDKRQDLKIPDMELTITYNDIAGNIYKKGYVLKFKPFGTDITISNTILHSSGFLEIKELF